MSDSESCSSAQHREATPNDEFAAESHKKPTVVSEEFKDSVKEWVDLYDKKAEAKKHLAVLNKRQKELHDYIMDYMKRSELDGINVRDGKLKLAQSKTVGSLKKDNVASILTGFFTDDPSQAARACEFLFQNRGVTIRERLKRTKSRSPNV